MPIFRLFHFSRVADLSFSVSFLPVSSIFFANNRYQRIFIGFCLHSYIYVSNQLSNEFPSLAHLAGDSYSQSLSLAVAHWPFASLHALLPCCFVSAFSIYYNLSIIIKDNNNDGKPKAASAVAQSRAIQGRTYSQSYITIQYGTSTNRFLLKHG